MAITKISVRGARQLYRSREKSGEHKAIVGAENIDKVIRIDQSPIGRTPRSNPATYTGVFTAIRDLYAMLPVSYTHLDVYKRQRRRLGSTRDRRQFRTSCRRREWS